MRRLAIAMIGIACSGCGQEPPSAARPNASGPLLADERRHDLIEPDSLFLGSYVFYASSERGDAVVADMSSGALAVYDSLGHFVRRLGRTGAGPGELRAPRAVAFLRRGQLVGVNDMELQRLSIFDATDAAFRGSLRSIGRELGLNWVEHGDTVYNAVNGADFRVQKWVTGMDSAIGIAPTPPERLAEIFTVLQHGRAEIAEGAEGTLILAETATDRLLVMDRAGNLLDSLTIPAVRRKGAPPELLARAREQQRRRDPDDVAPLGSTLAGFGRLDDSLHAVVWLDVGQIAPASNKPGRSGLIFGDYRMYVSVLNIARRQACVDGHLPVQTDVMPSVSVQNGRLHVLTRIVDSAQQARTRVHSFAVDLSPCTWLSTEPPAHSGVH